MDDERSPMDDLLGEYALDVVPMTPEDERLNRTLGVQGYRPPVGPGLARCLRDIEIARATSYLRQHGLT